MFFFKKEDFKIGNYVFYNKKKHVGCITEIKLKFYDDYLIGLNSRCDIYYSLLQIYPIRIDEGWLLKLGFIRKYFNDNKPFEGYFFEYNLAASDKLTLISGEKNGCLEIYLDGFEDLFRYKYVHQVQNIINSLTEKKGDIKF